MKKRVVGIVFLLLLIPNISSALIIDHNSVNDFDKIPSFYLERAKAMLNVSFGHTSHGSQIISGVEAMRTSNISYNYTDDYSSPLNSPLRKTLSFWDMRMSGANDLGNPDRIAWVSATSNHITGMGSTRNAIMWSWCGQVSSSTVTDIDDYLRNMTYLETTYPSINFIYMTGHLDGSGPAGNLYLRNNQIRDYARNNNKILFDFADIESYAPNGTYYSGESDACNWCSAWCSANPNDCLGLTSSCAHSHPYNCKLKAKAFWYMMARLAGWDGNVNSTQPHTYYVAINGNDLTGDGSYGNPWRNISYGISRMSGGDELVIKNGTYTGNSNRIINLPNGTSSAWTKIRAEHDFGVTLSNQTGGSYVYPLYLNGDSYIEIRGINFREHYGLKAYIYLSDHIKLIRCSSDGGGGASSSFSVSGSNNVLIEECFAFGNGRYPFAVTQGYDSAQTPSYNVVFRRNLCRWDYSNTTEPQACFADYDQKYVAFQNNIALDGIDNNANPSYTYDGIKGFFTPNGANYTFFDGNIVLNFEGTGYYLESSPVQNSYLRNNIAWNVKDLGQAASEAYVAQLFHSDSGTGPVGIDHCTFGVTDYWEGVASHASDALTNSIIYGVQVQSGHYAVEGVSQEDYNCFYNNNNLSKQTTLGSHSLSSINPLTNSLLYLPRIESGSNLSGRASDGGNIGATILKKIGRSGTLWGESGWNETTNDNLWPWPNEDVIKREVALFYRSPGAAYYNSPEIIGARGFAASGNGLYGGPITLTSYIWEYLGNPCPADICNYGGNFSSYHESDLNQNGLVELRELINYISRFKALQVQRNNLLTAVSYWFRGIDYR